jgi:hypothetical protein
VPLLRESLERLLEDEQYMNSVQNTLSRDFGEATGDSLTSVIPTDYRAGPAGGQCVGQL